MDFFLEGLGWVGASLVLAAYGLLSAKKMSADSFIYHGLNISGAGLLAIYACWKDAGASVLINVIWMFIGAHAIIALRRAQRREKI
jgi:hypothetical protein